MKKDKLCWMINIEGKSQLDYKAKSGVNNISVFNLNIFRGGKC